MSRSINLTRGSIDWLEVNGKSLRYIIEGAGEPIVLVHEMGGCIESWDGISSQLSLTNTVIRYDQRSAGQSEKDQTPFSLDDLAAALADFLLALGIMAPVHLVGSAFGAAQALRFTAEYADAVASLVLLAPATTVTPAARSALDLRATAILAHGMRANLAVSLDRAWPVERRNDAEFFRKFRGRYLANDPQAFALHNRALAAVEPVEYLNKLNCPVLVVAGRHDVVRPVDQLCSLAETLPSAGFVIVDSGHFIAAEAPDAILAVLAEFYGHDGCRKPRHIDIAVELLSEEQSGALAEATQGTRGRPPAPMRAWLANPHFARRAQYLGETLRYHTSLGSRSSELAILATARYWRSEYEWRVHARAGAEAGLNAEVIEGIRIGRVAPDLITERDRIVLQMCAAVHLQHFVSDELFARADAALGRAGLAELIGILGYYTLVSMTLNVYQIGTADPRESPFPPSQA